jgi:hypothetical protein
MPHTATYTDNDGQEWCVREIVSYARQTPPPGQLPQITRAALIFELGGARLIADDAPLDWGARPDALSTLFARARRLPKQ